MENVYGIGVANRYALFLDEDSDPLDILKQSEAEQKIAKAKKIEDATKPVAKGPAVKKDAGNTRNEAGELINLILSAWLSYRVLVKNWRLKVSFVGNGWCYRSDRNW